MQFDLFKMVQFVTLSLASFFFLSSDKMLQLINSDEIEEDFYGGLKMQNARYVRIVKNIRNKIRGGKFHFFGSRIMGIASPDSDLDIFIAFGKFSISLLFALYFDFI